MIKVIVNPDSFLVEKHYTIKKCMAQIEMNKKGVVLVVTSEGKLEGSLSDGDIRRALLKGKSTDQTIEGVFFKNPISLSADHYLSMQVENLFKSKRISVLPVIDSSQKILKLLTWSPDAEGFSIIDNQVVLMVGGLGTRLAPLTDHTPKPLLKVGGKPILGTILDRLSFYGFRNVVLCTGYRHEDIVAFCGNGEKFGLKISYFKENQRLGTIGAIKKVEEYLSKPFLVMNGDLLTLLNYRNILNYHIENKSDLTIGSTSHQMKVPYGVLEIEGINIKQIKEKPTYIFRINGGIYVLDPSLLKFIPEDNYFDITDLISKALKDERKLTAFPIEEYWMDIGQHDDYEQANSDFKSLFSV